MGNLNELTNEIDNFEMGESFQCFPEECLHHVKDPSLFLKILQQNIRSLNKNFNALSTLLVRLNFVCDVIVLSECWLSCTGN